MKNCNYSYLIKDISEGKKIAFKAIIPKFPKMLVMADTPKELHEAVVETIELAIKQRKKEGRPIPERDTKSDSNFKGTIIIRTTPQLHERLYYEAQANQLSLNKYIESKLLA